MWHPQSTFLVLSQNRKAGAGLGQIAWNLWLIYSKSPACRAVVSKQDQFPSTPHALWPHPQGWGICNRRGRREQMQERPTWSFCMRFLQPCWELIVLSKPCPIASDPVGGKGDLLLLPQQGQTDHSATIHCVCTTTYLYGCLHITTICWMPFCCLNMMVGSPHPQLQLSVFTVLAWVFGLPIAGPWPTACSTGQCPKSSQWAPEDTSALVALCFWFPTSDAAKIAGRKKKKILLFSSVL